MTRISMRRAGVFAALPLVMALVAGCGDQVAPSAVQEPAPQRPVVVPAADGSVTTGRPVTVLDEGDGPAACLGAVAFSLPPQCDGIPLVGWDWAAQEGRFQQTDRVRWGRFVLTGGFDGDTLAVEEVVPEAAYDGPPLAEEGIPATPCDAPPDGWSVVDPALTTMTARQEAFLVAEQMTDYARAWSDQSINPAFQRYLDGDLDPEVLADMDDPSRMILNVAVTGDVSEAETKLRRVWGGPLCVSHARHTRARLKEVAEELIGLPGDLGGSYGNSRNRVELDVVFDDGSFQRWADAEYGEGVVAITSALTPTD